MSESGPPPPLPPFARPMPVLPIPVEPLPEHGPSGNESYGYVQRRPGIITAVAILSITLGSLGMITGGLCALYGSLFYFVASQTRAFANMAQAPPAIAPATAVATGEGPVAAAVDANGEPIVGDRGLDATRRKIIVGVLASQRPMNDARRRQIHALLATAGQDIFPGSANGVGSSDIQRAINQSGQLPRALDTDRGPGADYFVIATGRIEISDDRAVFEPADQSQETVRVSAPSPATGPADASAGINTGAISQQEVQTFLQIVNVQSGNRLTPQQRNTLATEFGISGGLLRPPAPGTTVGSEISRTICQPDGSVFVFTANGQVQVAANGVELFRYIQSGPMVGVFTGNPLAIRGKHSPIRRIPAMLVIGEAGLSVLLSIYLLVIGILALRQNRRGRGLHMIYAIVKIPLAIVSGIAWSWLVGGLFAAIPGNQAAGASVSIRVFLMVMMTGMAILYPVGLIITFSTPFVRRYYEGGLLAR